jgi:hypothetical protein
MECNLGAHPPYICIEMTKKVDKALPIIRDISWVRSPDLSDKRIDVGDETDGGSVKRAQVIYKYESGGKRQLILVPPRDDGALFRTNGVEEDSYVVPKTGARTMLGRNVIKLYMDNDNEAHKEFYDTLVRIRGAVKKRLDKDKGSKTNVQIKGLYDLMDDEKNITGHVLVARLIESRSGDIYSAAYNDEDQIDITTIGRCVVRPALVFQYTIPDDADDYRISVSVTQLYAKTQHTFPLRDRD